MRMRLEKKIKGRRSTKIKSMGQEIKSRGVEIKSMGREIKSMGREIKSMGGICEGVDRKIILY